MSRRAAVAAAFLVAWSLVGAAPAGAHAVLQATTPPGDAVVPSAPDEVTLTFDEPVEVGLGGVKVLAPNGERVDTGAARTADGSRVVTVPVDAPRRGTYTVVWSVTSEDNHTISGTVLFSVGTVTGGASIEDRDDSTARAAGVAGRWLAVAGTLAVIGGVVSLLVVLDGAGRASGGRTIGRVTLAGATAVVAGSLVALVAQIAISADRSLASAVSVVGDAVAETRFGPLAVARLLFGLIAGLGGWLQLRERSQRSGAALAGVVAVGLALVPAMAGHAWTTSPRALAVVVDASHFAAAGVWIGGLLALGALTARGQGGPSFARRFSSIAVGAVGVVVVTGLVSSYLQVRSLDALFGTGYGTLLLAKVAGVVGLVVLGALNRARLRRSPEARGVLRLVGIEVVIAAVVVALTATLVNRPPARSDLAKPFSGVEQLEPGDGRVQLEVQPARVGTNDLHVYFLSAQGIPAPVDAVEVSVGRPGIPLRRVTVTPVTADHASAYAVALPSAGAWTVEVVAAQAGEERKASFEVGVR